MQSKSHPSQTGVPAARQYGTSGRPVKVIANTFAIKTLPTQTIFHYDAYADYADDASLRSQLSYLPFPKAALAAMSTSPLAAATRSVHQMQNITAPAVFNPRAFFDGKKNLFSVGPLKIQGTAAEFVVSMSDRPQPPGSTRGQFRVRLTKVNDINISQRANDILTGGSDSQPNCRDVSSDRDAPGSDAVRAIAVCRSKTTTYNSRSVFTSEKKKPLSGGFNLWNGFFQSVRPTIHGLVVNVDVSHAVIYEEMPVLDWACAFLSKFSARRQRFQPHDLERLGTEDLKLLRSTLRGVRVTVTVPAGGRRPARPIKDLHADAGNYAFMKGDEETTIKDYYNEKYGFRLRFPRLFGIVINVQHKTIVPVEICTIVGGQMYKKVLFPEQMSEVLQHATRSPRERIEAIERGVQGDFLDYKNSPFFSQIGMQVDVRPMETAARLLQPPDIQYNGSIADLSVQAEKQTGTHGVWNVVRRQFFKPAPRSLWTVVSFATQSFPLGDVEQSVMRLKQCCEKLGMGAEVVGGRVASAAGGVERALEEALAQLDGKISQLGVKPRPPCLVLVVLPDSAAAQRKAVKAWGDVTRQVATQCVKTMKFRNPNDQYCNNVALKVNVKLGGINSYPVNQIYNGLNKEPTMVVGADVTHPGPGVRDRPSIASLVSSFDPTFSRYAAFTKVQAPRMEVIEELEDMFFTALRYFLHVNRVCPKRVIFYRDGVSDGEFQAVEELEIKALSEAWNSIKDKTGNIYGGLVVDKEVANPHKMDFYLQSHPGLKGTSRPSHYVVLYNKLGFSIDIIQQISYFLCHAYARCTRSVSIPAPVYYADIVCSRAGFYLDESLGFSDSGGSGPGFDLAMWRKGFNAPGPQNMYFV
ncbi:ribonuclease H-like domain-containing protein [Lactarius deliciosus]|nr:ribonuclease H-like domain-containing protein [Lactarius deliciosus]